MIPRCPTALDHRAKAVFGEEIMNDQSGVSVVALVFIEQGEQILLVKQGYGRQYWSLPGGVMEPGESIDAAAVREVKEETGLDVELKRVVGLYSKPEENGLAVCFEGKAVGGHLRADHEVVECGYFRYEKLPEPVREHLHQRIGDFRRRLADVVVRTQ